MINDLIDAVDAIRGKDHCAWCNINSETAWEKLCQSIQSKIFDRSTLRSMKLRSLYHKYIWDWSWHLHIWKIGQEWHSRYHYTDEEKAAADECPCYDHCELLECTLIHEWGKGRKLQVLEEL